MELKIGKRLRNLRMDMNITQEALAGYLGVTPQAVSKWERDEGLPDISLLPGIAQFYHVTVDRILGVEENIRRDMIASCKEKDLLLMERGQHMERVQMWKEALNSMPNDAEIMHYLCFALKGQDLQGNADEIIRLSKEILSKTSVSGEYFGAINNICRAFSAKGDMNSAKKYAAMAGRYVGTENQLMIRILEGESAVSYCQWNIETLMDLIASNAEVMLKKGKFSAIEKISVCDTVLQLYRTILGECYGFYHCRIAEWNIRKAGAVMDTGDISGTIACMKKAVEHANLFDEIKSLSYTSVILNKSSYRKDKVAGSCGQRIERLITDGRFTTIDKTLINQVLEKLQT